MRGRPQRYRRRATPYRPRLDPGAARRGPGPVEADADGDATAAGCLLAALSAAAMLGAGFCLARRLYPVAAITGAAGAGALCFVIGRALLRRLAIPIWRGAGEGESPDPELWAGARALREEPRARDVETSRGHSRQSWGAAVDRIMRDAAARARPIGLDCGDGSPVAPQAL